MTIFILGENGSGKSAYAERLITQISTGPLYYIATMIPYGEEGSNRVRKHKKQREQFNFITIEKPYSVSELIFTNNAAVLLEDVSNLLSNGLFCEDTKKSENEVFTDITDMCKKCSLSVLVSIGGLTPNGEYSKDTCRYIDELNNLNRRLFEFSDTVITMKNRKPVYLKGEIHVID